MKRRQFIQKSALTAAALAMPWSKMLAQAPAVCSTSFQEFKWVNEKKDSFKIVMDMCEETITNFEKSEAERKIIKLIINQNIKDEQGKINIKEYKAELKIKSVKKDKSVITDFRVETEFLQENKKEYDLPKELNVKKLSLVYHEKEPISSIDVLDKKGNIYLTILEKPASTSDNDDDDLGCFLTTACVNILGKADHCSELSTLRKFRDEHLKNNEEGLQLVHEYYHIAPQIVKAISIREDKQTIYTDIYNKMIMPTIDCIEKNHYSKAISVYKDYTMMLRDQYLLNMPFNA